MVFDVLAETQHFNGYVLLLEEDHYVSPDFVVTTRQLARLKQEYVLTREGGREEEICIHWTLLCP